MLRCLEIGRNKFIGSENRWADFALIFHGNSFALFASRGKTRTQLAIPRTQFEVLLMKSVKSPKFLDPNPLRKFLAHFAFATFRSNCRVRKSSQWTQRRQLKTVLFMWEKLFRVLSRVRRKLRCSSALRRFVLSKQRVAFDSKCAIKVSRWGRVEHPPFASRTQDSEANVVGSETSP